MGTKFGRQPVRVLLHEQRWSVAAAARHLGLPYAHLSNCVNGRIAPSKVAKSALVGLLGRPEELLFTPHALAACSHGPRPHRRPER